MPTNIKTQAPGSVELSIGPIWQNHPISLVTILDLLLLNMQTKRFICLFYLNQIILPYTACLERYQESIKDCPISNY